MPQLEGASRWWAGNGHPLLLLHGFPQTRLMWRDFAADADGRPVDGGHFFPEEHPAETAEALRGFFGAVNATPR